MNKMPFTAAGLLLMAIGTVLADSQNIWIPIMIMAAGALLTMTGKKRGEQDEQHD